MPDVTATLIPPTAPSVPAYEPAEFWDEMFEAPGRVRPHYAALADCLGSSALVPFDADLAFLAAPFASVAVEDAFSCARSLMEFVYQESEYASQVTTVATTVADVLAHRRGVCQDFAHVFDRRPGCSTRGAEASHAWVEAFTPTHGWRGFDPTNNLVASEYHIKMAIGRDYGDVAPTRGTFRGPAMERLTVSVHTAIES